VFVNVAYVPTPAIAAAAHTAASDSKIFDVRLLGRMMFLPAGLRNGPAPLSAVG
jgi:hypothetical protein